MKKLVKLSAIAALFLFSSLAANAQIKVGINGGVQLPMGDFKDVAKTGFGGGLSGKYLLNPNMGVGLNVGLYSFDGKETLTSLDLGSLGSYDYSTKTKNTIIPVTANFTYYFGEGALKPYVGVDLGLSFISSKYTTTSSMTLLGTTTSASADSTVSSSKFTVAPVIGVEYSFSDNLALDLNAKYNMIFDGTTKTTVDADDNVTTKKSVASTIGINLGLVYTIK